MNGSEQEALDFLNWFCDLPHPQKICIGLPELVLRPSAPAEDIHLRQPWWLPLWRHHWGPRRQCALSVQFRSRNRRNPIWNNLFQWRDYECRLFWFERAKSHWFIMELWILVFLSSQALESLLLWHSLLLGSILKCRYKINRGIMPINWKSRLI